MFLPLPRLDDRRWDDLVEEARALIPLHAPEWTDHNVSDPGITVAELSAWIAEQEMFQLDQVPARHRRKFLALLGIVARPPVPAHTVLRFDLPAGTPPVIVPADMHLEGHDPYGNAVAVRTLWPVQVVASALRSAQAQDADGATDLTDRLRRGEGFTPFGPDPRPGDALVLRFTDPVPPGVRLDLTVTPAHPTVWLSPEHHSARTVWELRVGPGRWARLSTMDETRALTQAGRVHVNLPAGSPGEAPVLRCRLATGGYDAAPLLRDLSVNAVPAAQSVAVGELTWAIAEGATVTGSAVTGRADRIGLRLDADGRIIRLDVGDRAAPMFRVLDFQGPATGAPGSLTIEASRLGWGSGEPRQTATCAPAPVDADSIRVYTMNSTTWHRWTLRPDFDASTPADRHTVLDPTTGRLTFGDGRRGRAVPDGAAIVVAYRRTHAGAGNLPAARIDTRSEDAHNAALLTAAGPEADRVRLATFTNPIPVAGGAAAETLEHAEARAAELANEPTRAVTTADYETLARQTPGTRIARVAARPNMHPGLPCVTAIGVITVIILPYLPAGRPMPSRGLMQAVAAHLCPRRLVGTRVEVTGPLYTEVAVRARVRANATASIADLSRRIPEAMDAFFDPLTGGLDGGGWPFGRDVYRLEVMQVLDEVPGIDQVEQLELLTAEGARCGNVCLGPIGLVAAGRHDIEVIRP